MQLSLKGTDKGNFTPITVDSIDELKQIILNKDYSFGTFKDNHRVTKNFEGAEFIGLDFDDGLTLEQATEAFKDQWHIIATTKSHQMPKKGSPACDRFRVILKPEKRIESAADFKATVKALMSDFPDADPACSDATRFFFSSQEIICENLEGTLQPVVKYVAPEPSTNVVAPYMKGQLALSTLKFIAMGAGPSHWNQALYKAAKDLQQQQWTQEEATEILRGATRMYEGDLNDEDLGTINSAFKDENKHAPRGVQSMFDFKHPNEMSKNVEELDWLVDGLQLRSALSLIVGPSKAGKSTITRQLALAVARGGEWLGRKVKKGKVLYLALEEQENMLKHQLNKLGIQDDDGIYYHVGAPKPGDLADNLTQSINHFEADLVVIDTMVLLAGFENINDYDDVYQKLSIFRNIARDTNAHIMLIHHTNKTGDALGSTAILGAIDCYMKFSEVHGSPRFRKIESKQRGGKPFVSQRLEYIESEDIYRTVNSPSTPEF